MAFTSLRYAKLLFVLCCFVFVTVITAEPIKKDRYNYTAHGNEYEVRYSLQHSGRKVHNLDEWVKEATTDADHSILTGLVELSYSNSTDDANGKVVFRFNSRANASRFPEMFEQRCSFHNILTGHPAWGLQSHLETHGFLFFIEGRPSLIDNNVSIPVSVAELHHVFHHGEINAQFPINMQHSKRTKNENKYESEVPASSTNEGKGTKQSDTVLPFLVPKSSAKLLVFKELWKKGKAAYKKTAKAIKSVVKKVVETIKTVAELVVEQVKKAVDDMTAFLSNIEFSTSLSDGGLELGSFNKASDSESAKCSFGMDTVGLSLPPNVAITCTDCWARFEGGANLRLKFTKGKFGGVSFTLAGSALVKLEQSVELTGEVEFTKAKQLYTYVGSPTCVTVFMIPICVIPSAQLDFFAVANSNQAVPALSAGVKVKFPFSFSIEYKDAKFSLKKTADIQISEKSVEMSSPSSASDIIDGALASTDLGVSMKLMANFNGVGGPTVELISHINSVTSFDSSDKSCPNPKMALKTTMQTDAVVTCKLAVRIAGGKGNEAIDSTFPPVEVLSESEALKNFCFDFSSMIGTAKKFISATTTTITTTTAASGITSSSTSSSTTTTKASGGTETSPTAETGGNTFVSATSAEALLNPFLYQEEKFRASPACVDIDGDGDIDCFVSINKKGGDVGENFIFFKNIGTASAPSFMRIGVDGPGNPFTKSLLVTFKGTVNSDGSYTGGGRYISPLESPVITFADVDGDGDYDALCGYGGSTFVYFQNTGTATAATFVRHDDSKPEIRDPDTYEVTGTDGTEAQNPFYKFHDTQSLDGSYYPSPAFCDFNGDGKMDLVVGFAAGLRKFANTGTTTSPVFTAEAWYDAVYKLELERQGYPEKYGTGTQDKGGTSTFKVTCLGTGVILGYPAGYLLGFNMATMGFDYAWTETGGLLNDIRGQDPAPTFADLDGDGDADLVVGLGLGTVDYYINSGTDAAPVFNLASIKPNLQSSPENFSPDLIRQGATISAAPENDPMRFTALQLKGSSSGDASDGTEDDVSYGVAVDPFASMTASSAGVGRAYTVSFWVRTTSTNTNAVLLMYEFDCMMYDYDVFMQPESSENDWTATLKPANSPSKCSFGIKNPQSLEVWSTLYDGTDAVLQSGISVADGKWHHVLWRFKNFGGSQEAKIWVDGTSKYVTLCGLYSDGTLPSFCSAEPTCEEGKYGWTSGVPCTAAFSTKSTYSKMMESSFDSGGTNTFQSAPTGAVPLNSSGIMFIGQKASRNDPRADPEPTVAFTGMSRSASATSHQYDPAASFVGEIATVSIFHRYLESDATNRDIQCQSEDVVPCYVATNTFEPMLRDVSFYDDRVTYYQGARGIFQRQCIDCMAFFAMDPYDPKMEFSHVDVIENMTPRKGLACSDAYAICHNNGTAWHFATMEEQWAFSEAREKEEPKTYTPGKMYWDNFFNCNPCETTTLSGFIRGMGFEEKPEGVKGEWPFQLTPFKAGEWVGGELEVTLTQGGFLNDATSGVTPFTCVQAAKYEIYDPLELTWEPPCTPGESFWCKESCTEIYMQKLEDTSVDCTVPANDIKLILTNSTYLVGRYCLSHDGVCAENGKCMPATQNIELYPAEMCTQYFCPKCFVDANNQTKGLTCSSDCTNFEDLKCTQWAGPAPLIASARNIGGAGGSQAGLLADSETKLLADECDPTENYVSEKATAVEEAGGGAVIDVGKAVEKLAEETVKKAGTPTAAAPTPAPVDGECCNTTCCWCKTSGSGSDKLLSEKEDTASLSDEEELPMCASTRLHASESGIPALLVVSVASVMYFVAYSS